MSPDRHPGEHPPANASTALARTLLATLVEAGVRDLVVAPGSRSAPLALAAHDLAQPDTPARAGDDAPWLRLHVRVDERSAGFLALGLARTSHRPVAVLTTSGTAVANLHPAVLEASHAGVPLVLLTADRPARLRGTGANQTTEQPGIFGPAVRLAADVPAGHPGGDEARQLAAWRALAVRAAGAASGHLGDGRLGGRPGPVHLNVQLEEPLLPGDPDGWSTPVANGSTGGARSAVGAATALGADAPRPQRHSLRRGPRTVVVAGDDAGPPARILAQEAGWPLLAEPTSGSRTGDAVVRTYRLLLGDPDLAGRVERVVVHGHPTLSRPVTRLLSRDDVELVVVGGPGGFADPGHRAALFADAVALADDVGGDPGAAAHGADEEWLAEWRTRDADVSARLDALLAEEAAAGRLTPWHVAGAVSLALPAGGLLFVGSSNPVRDLDLMVAPYRVGDRRMVVGNRGLAGIDGAVSSAVGAALGRPRSTRALALLGDLTFLHDANGLVLGPDEPRPDLTMVVANDDGGSVFATLEQGGEAYVASFERLFGTPHRVDLAALCAATRTPHRRVTTPAALEEALATPAGGIEVVEAVVRRDDRRALDARIRALARP